MVDQIHYPKNSKHISPSLVELETMLSHVITIPYFLNSILCYYLLFHHNFRVMGFSSITTRITVAFSAHFVTFNAFC